jgi:hypothetical protein
MSWLFSQALVEEYSEASSLDGEQSAQSSGNHTQQAYCAPDKMTAFSKLSRFGMTYKPLTATHGEALLMSYLAAFRAKTSPQRGGAGIDGERSGMWREMARIVCEVGPKFVFVENSPMLTSRGLGVVLGDLASMGFDARWGVLGAADIGANHQRDRIWIVARNLAHSGEIGLCGKEAQQGVERNVGFAKCGVGKEWWEREPEQTPREIEREMGGMADGMASRMDQIKSLGNGQVPLCAATAWRILSEQ